MAQVYPVKVTPAAAQEAITQKTSQVTNQLKKDSRSAQEKARETVQAKGEESKNAVLGLFKQKAALGKQLLSLNRDSLKNIKLPPLFKLSGGQVSLMRQIGERQGAYPAVSPVTFTRFSFNGGVQIAGIPLRVQSLYSTEQSSNRQPMNRTGVSLDMPKIRQAIEARINERIRLLEQLTSTHDLKDLDKLSAFYDKNNLPKLTGKELGEYLKTTAELDSLKNLPEQKARAMYQKQEKKYRKQLADKQDSVLTLAHQRQGLWKNKAKSKQDSLESKHPLLSKRIRKYMQSEKISVDDVKHWQDKRDSLQKLDQERLLHYEEITALKAARKGDISQSIAVLKKYHLLSGPLALLGYVKTFGVGTQYPHYTPFTLRDIPVTGINVALQPGPFYLAYTGSKSLSAVPQQTTYARKLQAGRAGVGTETGNHLFINVLHGRDDRNSFRGDSLIDGFLDTTFYNKPRENYLVGSDFRWQLKKGLSLEGEWAHSVTAMNLQEQRLSTQQVRQSLFRQTDDTSHLQTGQAVALQLQSNLGRSTTISMRGEQIGSGFYSQGAPYLRNDVRGVEWKLNQSFFKRKLTIAPQYGRWMDNVSGKASQTGTMQTYGVKAGLTIPKRPYVVVMYLRNTVQNPMVESLTSTTNITTGYSYQLSSFQTQSSLVASQQRNSTRQSDSLRQASIQNLTFTQTFNFAVPILLSFTGSYMKANQVPVAGQWFSYGGNVSYTFRGVWQTSVGVLQGNNEAEGLRQNQFAETKVTVKSRVEVALRVERNVFETKEVQYNYRELFGNLTLSSRF
jgi:hypothetical protein